MTDVNLLLSESLDDINKCKTTYDVEELRIYFLGEKGKLTEVIKTLHNLSSTQKVILTSEIYKAKKEIIHALETKKAVLEDRSMISLMRHPENWR